MEPEKNEERKFFENLIASLRGLAQATGMKYIKGLNMDRLADKEKADFIAMHLNQAAGNIKAIGRLEYCTDDMDQLWELFKNRGFQNNAEEIQKLQDMMIQSEIFRRLRMLELDVKLRQEATRKTAKKDARFIIGEVTSDDFYEVLKALNEEYHLVAAPSTIDDLVRAAQCHDWSEEKEPIYTACMTTVLKGVVDCIKRFNPDFSYANIGRCKLFISKGGNLVTAHDLGSSICSNPTKMLRIESFFARLRKKH